MSERKIDSGGLEQVSFDKDEGSADKGRDLTIDLPRGIYREEADELMRHCVSEMSCELKGVRASVAFSTNFNYGSKKREVPYGSPEDVPVRESSVKVGGSISSGSRSATFDFVGSKENGRYLFNRIDFIVPPDLTPEESAFDSPRVMESMRRAVYSYFANRKK